MKVSSVSMVGNYSSNYNLKMQNKKVLSQSVDAPATTQGTSFKGIGKIVGMAVRAAAVPFILPGIALVEAISKTSDEDISDILANDIKDIITGEQESDSLDEMDADEFYRYIHSRDL